MFALFDPLAPGVVAAVLLILFCGNAHPFEQNAASQSVFDK